MAVVGHLGQHQGPPWWSPGLIEGPALTAQGKTRPFLSYYGLVRYAWMVKNSVRNRALRSLGCSSLGQKCPLGFHLRL